MLNRNQNPLKKQGLFQTLISACFVSFLSFSAFLVLIYLSSNELQSDYPKPNLYSLKFTIPSICNNSKQNLTIDLHKSIFYTDIWRGHWCPYYNDRNDFIAQRVNEILQNVRNFHVPVAFISFAAEASMKNEKQRKKAKLAINSGNISAIRSFKPRPNESYHLYNPNFTDSCIYHVKNKFSEYLDYDFSRKILIAEEDIFVANFEEAAMLFLGYNSKFVFIFGEHTNMCLMHVILYCKKIGIVPVIVGDLTDCGWNYAQQKNTLPTHSKANQAVLAFLQNKGIPIINSYDLLFTLKKLKGKSFVPHYKRNLKTAFYFKNL